jgi:signal transduction histidine kinase/ActR/RegA family two-component response regulator
MADPSSEQGDRLSFAVEILTRHGARVPVQITTRIVRDTDGAVRGILGSARRIGELHPADPTGRKRPSHLRILIEHLPEGIALLDHDGTILLTNPPAEDFLKEYGTFLADNRLVLFGGIPIERILERASAMLRQEVVVREPYHQILEVTGQGFSDEDSIAGAVLVIRDVTSERQRRERLERNDRLAAVGQLAAGIAHDFKNILQGIHLCAELSRPDHDSAAGHKDNMLTIIEQAERGSKLIQQIMDFTRQSESTQRLLDMGDLLTDTCELLAPGIPESILLSVDIADGEHAVMADPGQVQQVLANLVLNARDAMPNGGRLTISLTEVGTEEDNGPVPIEVRDGEWLRITVADTGSGIPKSVQHRVFEPFFTTKRPGSGTGLGLAQVYGNVQQHGGYVDFESTVDIGTSFFVFLPAYRHHLRSESRSRTEGTCPNGHGETVLVVEDELSVLSATAQSLRSLGYQVFEAVDGEDALQVLDSQRTINLVLTDSRMPSMDGSKLVAELRRRAPDLKVIMMTAYAHEPGHASELPAGVDGLLRKPFSMEALAKMVHQTLISLSAKAEVGGRE